MLDHRDFQSCLRRNLNSIPWILKFCFTAFKMVFNCFQFKKRFLWELFFISEAEECVEGQVEDLKNAQESTRHLEDGSLQPTIDQAQQTTPGTILALVIYPF